MKKILLLLSFTASVLVTSYAQNSVGIGTNTPNVNAVLDLQSPTGDQGMLVPRLTTAERTGMTGSLAIPENGLLVYDTGDNSFWYWDTSTWVQIGGGADNDWVENADTIYNDTHYVVVGRSNAIDYIRMLVVNNGTRTALAGSSDGDGTEAIGVEGYATGSGINIGTLGIGESVASSDTAVGIHGNAFGPGINYAGLFTNGDVYVQDNLGVQTGSPISPVQIGNVFHLDMVDPGVGWNYSLLTNNLLFNGSNWIRTIAGLGGASYMGNGEYGIELFGNGGAGSSATNSLAKFELDSNAARIRTYGTGSQGLNLQSDGDETLILDLPYSGGQARAIWVAGDNFRVGVRAPLNTAGSDYDLTLPIGLPPASGDVLASDLAGNLYWTTPSAGGTDWSLSGNGGTTAGSDFLGTTDAQHLVFKTNNTENARLSTAGNLGIGDFSATNPIDNLEIRRAIGSATFNHLNTSQYSALQFAEAGSVFGFIGQWGSTSAINPLDIQIHNYYAGAGGIQFSVNGAANLTNPAMTIANSGNVGISTATPLTNLDVNGNVLIGSSGQFAKDGPDGPLHVFTSNFAFTPALYLENEAGGNTGYGTGLLLSARTSIYKAGIAFEDNASFGRGNLYFLNNSAANVANATKADARMTIDMSGNVGIGNTSPSSILDVTGNVEFSGDLRPNNLPGAAGEVLTSQGSGAAPIWQAAAGAGWDLTGNTGTVDGTNFIGTTDNVPFNIRVNNQKSGKITTSNQETAFGYQALNSNTAAGNTAFGYQTSLSSTTGQRNAAVGFQALLSNSTGWYNTAMGYEALRTTTNSYNTAFGYQSARNITSGSRNVAVGNEALLLNTTGAYNVAIGDRALYNNNASQNIGVGSAAAYNTTSGILNVAIGDQALYNNSTGSRNISIGFRSLQNTTTSFNTALGDQAGNFNTSGSSNTFIGYNADVTLATLTNATAIGANATVSASNRVKLGNAADIEFDRALMPGGLAGNSGEVLVSQGTGTPPIWQNASAASINIYNSNGSLTSDRTVTQGANALSFTASTTNAFSVDGTTFSVDAANNNVGIGTNAPETRLHVYGTDPMIRVMTFGLSTGDYAGIEMGGTNVSTDEPKAAIYHYDNSTFARGDMYFAVNNVADYTTRVTPADVRMMIQNSTGNVGIGNTSPNEKLEVTGNVLADWFRGDVINDKGTAQSLRLYGNGSVLFGADNNNDDASSGFLWYNNGESAANIHMRLDEQGDLGIGTTTDPVFKLSLHEQSTGINYLQVTNNTSGEGSGNGLLLGTNGSSMLLWNYEASDLLFGTSGTTRMNLEADGDLHVYNSVGIGATPAYPLDITANGSATYAAYVDQNKADAGTVYGLNVDVDNTYTGISAHTTYGIYGQALNNGGATSSTFGVRGYATGTSTGFKYAIYASTGGSGTRYAGYFVGDVYCTGAYLPSDQNLKRNVTNYNNALAQLNSLSIKEYEYIHDGDFQKMDLPTGRQIGIMAQDIEKVFPQLTKENQFNLNDDPENNDPNQEENMYAFKSVNYVGLVPITIKAIQEQQEEIDALKAENEMLKSKFDQQQLQIDELRSLMEKK